MYNAKYDISPEAIEAMTVIKKVIVYKNGIEIIRGMRFPTRKPSPPTNKGIYEMSRKSKNRLAHIVANCEINWRSLITLTYGDFFVPADGKELKRQLNIILGHFRKRFDCQYIWFMEFTKRERPHLHIITNIEPTQFDRIWLADKWAKISVKDTWEHLVGLRGDLTGKQLKHPISRETMEDELRKVENVHRHKKTWEAIYKPNGATRYALKYAAKEEQKLVPVQFGNCGRFWGTSRGVELKIEGIATIGEEISKEALEMALNKLLAKELPLLPRYLFIPDLMNKLRGEGLKFRDFNGQIDSAEDSEFQQDVVL